MEQTSKNVAQIDVMGTIGSLMPMLKRLWLLGLVLILLGTAAGYILGSWLDIPQYEATASFTVKVVNPLYSSASGYNAETAEQMAKTFPHILSSNALKSNVSKYLAADDLPEVTAEVIEGTNVFTLRVKDPNPQRAYDILQAVMACYPEVSEFVVGPTDMVLLDESGVPTEPAASNILLLISAAGALLGAAAWAAAALLLALTKNTVRNEDELKELLSCPCLGTLPAAKVVEKGATCPLVFHDLGKSGFADAVELIELHLERELKERKKKIVLISSAVPSEGKTTVSSNLAIAMAKKGKRTLLIDCDLRNPSVAKVFGESNRSGLAEFLHGKLTMEDAVRQSKVEGLHLIVGGENRGGNAVEKLVGQQMPRLLETAKNLYDCVILDTSPCGLIADASEIAELAECAVMVVRRDHASRSQILDGTRFLTDSKLPLVGAVLNGTYRHGGDGYGYGYGYGYSYGYGSGSR